MAYEYDHDCPFEAFITNLGKYNEGELVGEWVKFPTTSEELQKVFERIGIGSKDDFGNPYEEWFISDYDCYVDGLYEKLGEYENLDELNYLASKLDELDDHDYNHFQAAMQISDYTGSIKDVINLIDNLDKYEIYPGVESNADLGHYYIEELGMMEVPDYLADYIDYEAYGRDVAINEMGQFTDYGYVRDTQEYFTEYYDGDRENIPDEYRVMDFKVSGEKERKTMNYETFKQEFAEDIKEKLYERGYDDVRISFNNVEKTNQNYEAMSVVPEGSNVGVNFNIENAFANYEHTDDYAGVLASATMVIADGLDRAPAIDVSALMDYENMKEKLSVEVISADANADLLANVPHDRMEDLAVVYRFVMESSEDGRASILVTNNLMDRMGVSHEQLRADALENSPEIRPVVIMGMNEVMKEMIDPEVYEMFGIPDDAEETMYVATVPDKNSGAGVIAYQDFMDQAAERVGGDFFVLPSSINEILLVPDNGDMTADALRDMVKDVNAKEVSPEERLSDNVYHYDSKDHVFELAEKFEARQQEKKTEIDEKSEEKGSVLKDLNYHKKIEGLTTVDDCKDLEFELMENDNVYLNRVLGKLWTVLEAKETEIINDQEYEKAGPVVYSSRAVMEFKAKTEECFRPIDGRGAVEIEEMVEEYVRSKLMENGFDASVQGVAISGSRCRGLEGSHSDLDVVVELSGNEREDDLFNLLHEDDFSIGRVKVDINPITKNKTGTLEEYLSGVEKYLEEKGQKVSVREKLKEKKAAVKSQKVKSEKEGKKKTESLR